MSRNKARTLSNGLICNYQCKFKNCDYFLRCTERRLLIEYSGEHTHAEEEEPQRKRGLTKDQKDVIDRCISMNIRGGKSIATEFITHNDDQLKNGKPPIEIPNYRRINHYIDHTVNKEIGRTADLTLGRLKSFIDSHFPDTSDDDKTFCLHQDYKVESLSFQVHFILIRIVQIHYPLRGPLRPEECVMYMFTGTWKNMRSSHTTASMLRKHPHTPHPRVPIYLHAIHTLWYRVHSQTLCLQLRHIYPVFSAASFPPHPHTHTLNPPLRVIFIHKFSPSGITSQHTPTTLSTYTQMEA